MSVELENKDDQMNAQWKEPRTGSMQNYKIEMISDLELGSRNARALLGNPEKVLTNDILINESIKLRDNFKNAKKDGDENKIKDAQRQMNKFYNERNQYLFNKIREENFKKSSELSANRVWGPNLEDHRMKEVERLLITPESEFKDLKDADEKSYYAIVRQNRSDMDGQKVWEKRIREIEDSGKDPYKDQKGLDLAKYYRYQGKYDKAIKVLENQANEDKKIGGELGKERLKETEMALAITKEEKVKIK